MSRRLNRIWLLPVLLIASQSWALGLGNIRLNSALNEPLSAEIELLSATLEELDKLNIVLASSETFERYGIDRPLFLADMQFDIVSNGGSNIIRVTTPRPISEPFVTFLVEAVWSRGRLLREYTLLLDPPTFAPPPTQQSSQAVAAPTRSTAADSGTIERTGPLREAWFSSSDAAPPADQQPPQQQPQQQSQQQPQQEPQPQQSGPFDTDTGGDYLVQRGNTLWGISQSVRPDDRLNINQTMIAIYEANPQAFAGNINLMSAGSTLRIPSADEIFRISRGDALNEVRRQNESWVADTGSASSQPSLTLVAPDGDQSGYDGTVSRSDGGDGDAAARARISELEQQLEDQDSLLVIRDNELAALRAELARLRSEQGLPDVSVDPDEPVADADDGTTVVDEDPLADVDDPEIVADDDVEDPLSTTDTDEPATQQQPSAPPVVTTRTRQEPGFVDTVVNAVISIWGAIGAALIVVLGILVWFGRRAGRDEVDSSGVWNALDVDDLEGESLDSTKQMRALAREDESAIMVVEEEAGLAEDLPESDDGLDLPAGMQPASEQDAVSDTDTSRAMEDTFSSETAVNLDQSDPIAEADFHMAYGLYDQAADLINGALGAEPEREDLLGKLCEIYFVWGNRDGFVDAAQRLRAQTSDETEPAWDKIVIMGQQIAADHELFSGVTAGAATAAVDLSFDDALDEPGELDIDFASGADDAAADDVIDLGGSSGEMPVVDSDSSSIDFPFEEEAATADPSGTEETVDDSAMTEAAPAEVPTETLMDEAVVPTETLMDEAVVAAETPAADSTDETPTIEEEFQSLDATSELPALDIGASAETEIASLDDERPTDATAEINLDDLGLDLEALAESGLAEDLDDVESSGEVPAMNFDDAFEDTGVNDSLQEEVLAATGETPPSEDLANATGEHSLAELQEALAATGEILALDEAAGDAGQTLADDERTMLAPVMDGDDDALSALADDERTMLAPVMDGDDDSLPALTDDLATLNDLGGMADETGEVPEILLDDTGEIPRLAADETGEVPGMSGATDMDMDLDLSDLTAALQVSAVGDTVDRPRDDSTVEQPRLGQNDDADLDADMYDSEPTEGLLPEEVSADLHDARTMTEVGTKLDLARAYVDMGDPGGARSILEEVLDEGDDAQRQQAQQLLDTLPS